MAFIGSGSAAGSAVSSTSTKISLMPAFTAAATRRWPATTVSTSTPLAVVLLIRTSGGWMMPRSVTDASICASACGEAAVRRGLLGSAFSLRGSTDLSSMVAPCLLFRHP